VKRCSAGSICAAIRAACTMPANMLHCQRPRMCCCSAGCSAQQLLQATTSMTLQYAYQTDLLAYCAC
jgi:hypothetical protein